MPITINVKTGSRIDMVDITSMIQKEMSKSGIKEGICIAYVPHTTAGITINEGADPAVKRDILSYLEAQIPQDPSFTHSEGNSDAHIKSSLVGASEIILVEDKKLVLGTWQAIYFCEFDGPRNRRIHVQLTGDR